MAAKRCLSPAYGSENDVPTRLEDMTFDNYRLLIPNGENWPSLQPAFGVNRTRTSVKLREIGSIRNDLFHFRRPITLQDHEALGGHREWLLNKIKQAMTRSRNEVSL